MLFIIFSIIILASISVLAVLKKKKKDRIKEIADVINNAIYRSRC